MPVAFRYALGAPLDPAPLVQKPHDVAPEERARTSLPVGGAEASLTSRIWTRRNRSGRVQSMTEGQEEQPEAETERVLDAPARAAA
ncbi:hypothetical protein MOTC310_17680 [Methylobacterium oryzae]|uniref:Uncharacterized protein n=1 Tax=Methylobacterium oryzae TaxID=334852 RepID=A0ABU7TQV6_9HYPH